MQGISDCLLTRWSVASMSSSLDPNHTKGKRFLGGKYVDFYVTLLRAFWGSRDQKLKNLSLLWGKESYVYFQEATTLQGVIICKLVAQQT